jgi:hypothetical protein
VTVRSPELVSSDREILHPVTVFVRQFTVAVATSAWGRQLLAVVALNRRLFTVTAAAGYMGCALCLR